MKAFERAVLRHLERIEILLCEAFPQATPYVRLVFHSPTDLSAEDEGGDVSVAEIKDTQKVQATLSAVDARGNPASIEAGSVAWRSSDESIAAISVSDDGLTATISAAGGLGTAAIGVTADADLGEGVTAIEAEGVVNVIASQATALAIEFGPPADQ